MCYKLLSSNKSVDDKILFYLSNLSLDRINNVRITLAELVTSILKGNTIWKNNYEIHKIACRLKNDKVKTVRDYFKEIVLNEKTDSLHTGYSNNLFNCDMEFVYKEFGICNYNKYISRECK